MELMATLGACKLSIYLNGIATDEYYRKYEEFLLPNANDNDLQMVYEEMDNQLDELQKEEGEKLTEEQTKILYNIAAYKQITSLLEQDPLAITCLELAALVYMEPRARQVLSELCYEQSQGATMEAAAKILYTDYQVYAYYEEMKHAYHRIKKILFADRDRQDFFRIELNVDRRLVDYCMGSASGSEQEKGFFNRFGSLEELIPPIAAKELFHRGKQVLKQSAEVLKPDEQILVQITGEALSGRKFFAKHMAKELGVNLLLVDSKKILGKKQGELAADVAFLRREALFTGALICIFDVSFIRKDDSCQREYFLENVLEPLQGIGQFLFMTGGKDVKLTPFVNNLMYEVQIPECNRLESEHLWGFFSNTYLGSPHLRSEELANKMKLTPGQIEQIVKKIAFFDREGTFCTKDVCKLCYTMLDDGRYENIKRVDAKYTWDDLKLEKTQKDILKSIYNQIEYKLKVFVEWNLDSKFPYGKGVSALFTGPPGTGKTMAVHVLAGMLGLELYKVDLSQIVDKYIGETEKRLEEVFTRAEKSNMILFFDEADAIFGKRSETNDAKDKYANTEVSYILQRIEEYDGIIILATNYDSNIDPAFRRRIRHKVEFSMPSAEIRKSIWQSVFPTELPTDGLDFDYLAENFEFTGGLIKNIVLNAVFLAAAQDCPVGMNHILNCIKSENMKMGKMMSNQEFGDYATLL